MTTARTSFTPGDWAAVCGPAAWLLVKLPFDDARISRLYETLSATSDVDAVLDLLAEGGLASVPPFACVAVGEGAARVVVRHPAVAEVTDGDGTVTHAPVEGTTWTDVLTPATSVLLQNAGGAASGVRLPLHGGITPAAALTIGLDGVTPAAPAPAPAPTAAPAAAAVAPAPETEGEPEPAPETEPEAEGQAEPEIMPSHEPEEEDESLAKRRQTFVGLLTSDTTDRDALLAQLTEDPDEAEVADEPAPAPSQPNPLTAVWQVDEAPPAPGAAASEEEPEPTAPEAPAAPAAPAASSGGLIDGVPWLSGGASSSPEPAKRPTFVSPERVDAPLPPAAPAQPPASTPAPAEAAPPAADEQSETATVSRADLLKSLGSAGVVGPSVLAVTCPRGHATSPTEPTCRLCDAPVDDQEPTQIPRPPLGALVLGNGDRLVLDKDAILGRAPAAPEGATDRPHLLRVGDSGEISRQHARIILDGWHVIVRDLGTANGTTLTLPGGSPQQLRANEDYQLEDGAEIGIADLVTLRYEVKP